MRPSHCKLATLLLACLPVFVQAQALYKYTDKDGKVTYSDRVPKPGEKAVRVDFDPNANIMSSPPATRDGGSQTQANIKERVAARTKAREARDERIKTAETELEKAKKALEDAREPTPDERSIRVVRDKNGKPTGSNVILPTAEYREKIEKLEADVKKAEEKLDEARSK